MPRKQSPIEFVRLYYRAHGACWYCHWFKRAFILQSVKPPRGMRKICPMCGRRWPKILIRRPFVEEGAHIGEFSNKQEDA